MNALRSRLAILIGIMGLSASPASAQTVLFDGTFANPDWEHGVLYSEPTSSLGVVAQVAAGGNPGSYQGGEHTVNNPGARIYDGHVYLGGDAFDVASNGPIVSLTVEYDFRTFQGGVVNGLLVRQAGQNYIYNIDPGNPHVNWDPLSVTGLTDANPGWSVITATGPSGGSPDFSSNGAAVEFGYYTFNEYPPVRGGGGTGITFSWGIDNFRVTVCTPELCNGLDDDCDGEIDEDFGVFGVVNPDTGSGGLLPVNSNCLAGEGICVTEGRVMCSSDGMSAICVATLPTPGVEGPVDDASCFDFMDNDCDGLLDHEDPDCQGPEKCDSFDNDGDGMIDEDFPTLGDTCTVGLGICKKSGFIICNEDGTGVTCSAEPLPPGVEGPVGGLRCADGLDNDCDGLIDLDDPDCQSPEICDGKDNDGDGDIDEDFPTLGQPCLVGMGQCARFGVIVCEADGSGVKCSASPGPGSPEGPVGCGCADGIDNDCDGLIDLNDPDCGGADLAVTCALPYTCAKPDDCKSWHTVEVQLINPIGGETIRAELIGLDTNGEEISLIPVQPGDQVRLASRLAPAEFVAQSFQDTIDLDFYAAWGSCETGPDPINPLPVACKPLDRDCDDDIDLGDYASLQLMFGQVLEYHELVAPVPLLRVVTSNGLNEAVAYCSNVPYLEVLEPKGETITAGPDTNRVKVSVALPEIDPATLDLKIDGQHLFPLMGLDPATDFPGGPFAGQVNIGGCQVDICDLRVVTAPVDSPASNMLTMFVENQCCGGHVYVADAEPRVPSPAGPLCNADDVRDKGFCSVFEVSIDQPTDGEITPGGPTAVAGEVCHGRELECPFQTMCGPMVRLNGLFVPLGPPLFTPGDGESSADTYVYPFTAALQETDLVLEVINGVGVHGTMDPGANRLIAEATDPEAVMATDNVYFAVGPVHESGFRGATGVDKGLNLAMTPGAVQQIVGNVLDQALPALVDQELRQWLSELDGSVFEMNNKCDPTIVIDVDQGSFNFNPAGFLYFTSLMNDQMDVTILAPPASASASLKGGCEIKTCLFDVCVCWVRFTVNVTANTFVNGVALEFTLTEDDILNNQEVVPALLFDAGNVSIQVAGADIESECLLGFFIELLQLEDEVEAILVQLANFYINNVLDISKWLQFPDMPAIQLNLLELDGAAFPPANLELEFEKTAIEITPQGLSASWRTTFTPTQIDPEVPFIPGIPLTDAPLPQHPIAMSDELTVGISDDAINMLFHAMTRAGSIVTEFETETPISPLLPADCSTLEPLEWGACSAFKGEDCDLIGLPQARLACISVRATLSKTGIDATSTVLLHGRADAPPKLLIIDDPGTTDRVEAVLRLSQMLVALIVDRDEDGEYLKPYETSFDCKQASLCKTCDCILWEACLDMDFFVDLILTEPNGVPTISTNVTGAQLSTGTLCKGTIGNAGQSQFGEIASSMVIHELTNLIDNNTPPVPIEGLDFGGIVQLQNLRVIAIENDGNADFADYLAITADAN